MECNNKHARTSSKWCLDVAYIIWKEDEQGICISTGKQKRRSKMLSYMTYIQTNIIYIFVLVGIMGSSATCYLLDFSIGIFSEAIVYFSIGTS